MATALLRASPRSNGNGNGHASITDGFLAAAREAVRAWRAGEPGADDAWQQFMASLDAYADVHYDSEGRPL